MTGAIAPPIRDQADLAAFEQVPWQDRLPGPSILDVFTEQARRRPDRVAITMLMTGDDDEQPRRVTYGELVGLLRRAANAFHALAGPRAGVAYLLPNLVQTQVVLWGAAASGYAVPVNFLLQPENVAALVRSAGASVLVALGPHPTLDIWQKALAVRDLVPGLTLVRVGAPAAEDALDLDALMAAQPDDRLTFGTPGAGDDVATYLHTGGTTGNPRLVTLTHHSQLAAALGGMALAGMTPDDVLTVNLPFFHAGGTVFCSLSMLMAGGELLVMSPGGLRNPAMVAGFWRIAARYRATLVGAVPTGVAAVLEVPVDGADLSAVRGGFTGAASIPPAVGQRFREATGRPLFEVYGMTEASGLICIDPCAGPGAPGSVGIRLPYTQVEVRPVGGAPGAGGAVCPPGEVGAVVVRGPQVSPGYRDPAHDPGVFEDGWLLTGDLGYTDVGGNLFIAGRVKDLIIRSGHNIDPLMIENAMTEHPAVAVAAAVGLPDPYAGEVPVCYVSLQPGATATAQDLQEHARRVIGERPAWPREIHVVDAVPMTAVGKIFKPALRVEATRRLVEHVVHEDLGLAGAQVGVSTGGPRGTRVDVVLPAALADRCSRVEEALSPYLFQTVVTVAGRVSAARP